MATAALRLPGLRELPVFGDEAIHLHWSQLIVESPAANAFISMQDPKPPLHFWLMALFLPLFRDPVLAGRLISVLFGALSSVLVFEVASSLARRFPRGGEDPTWVGGAAAVVAILSPFAAFHQRIALAESLFLCESLLAAFLALRIAGAPENRARSRVREGVAFGAVMGAAMLTRQNFSYALWALPFCAWFAFPEEKRSRAPAFLRRTAVAGAVALLLWVPILIQKTGPDWKTRIFHVGGFREALPLAERFRHALRVAIWFWTYLTPPVALLALAALAWLFAAGRRRELVFLLLWTGIVVAPLLLFASLLYPRYTFTAAAPLWVACGFLLADLVGRLGKRPIESRAHTLLGASAFLVLFAWPVRDLALQCFRWRDQTLVPEDRWQYVTGWPAGSATEQAIGWLRSRAEEEPLVLVTPDVSGNPGDTTRILLGRERAITLFSSSDAVTGRVLTPASDRPGKFLLSGDLRKMIPPVAVELPAREPVYFLAPDPFLTREGWCPASEFFGAANPGISAVARFENPAGTSGHREAIVIFRLR
ncbi:MAG: glycosyltransferase family 39 protein [Acidobacteriota bacterium]